MPSRSRQRTYDLPIGRLRNRSLRGETLCVCLLRYIIIARSPVDSNRLPSSITPQNLVMTLSHNPASNDMREKYKTFAKLPKNIGIKSIKNSKIFSNASLCDHRSRRKEDVPFRLRIQWDELTFSLMVFNKNLLNKALIFLACSFGLKN